jgi:hypothetical protein
VDKGIIRCTNYYCALFFGRLPAEILSRGIYLECSVEKDFQSFAAFQLSPVRTSFSFTQTRQVVMNS